MNFVVSESRWGHQTAPRATSVNAPAVPKLYPDPKKLVTGDCIRQPRMPIPPPITKPE